MSINLQPTPYQDLRTMPVSSQIWYNQMRNYVLNVLTPGLNQFQPTYSTKFFDDFLTADESNPQLNASIFTTNFIRKCSATGASVYVTAPFGNEPGAINISNAAGPSTAGITTDAIGNSGPFSLNAGAATLEWRMLLYILSTASQEYVITVGAGNLDNTDAIIFTYDRATYGTNWQIVCKQFATGTTVKDTGVVVGINQYYKFTWSSNSNATSINFYINGNFVGTIADGNVPKRSGAYLPINCLLKKTVGTSQYNITVDYCAFQQVFNTANFR